MDLPEHRTRPDADLSVAPFLRPLGINECLGLLEGIAGKATDRIRRNDNLRCVRLFGDFLRSCGTDQVAIDEELLQRFELHLAKPPGCGGDHYRNTVVRCVREAANRLSPDILQRQIVCGRYYDRIRRFQALTPQTQQILKQFLTDGRKVRSRYGEKPTLLMELLAPRYRISAVDGLRRFLDVVGKNDVMAVTPDDVDKCIALYMERGLRDRAINMLADARAVFKNLFARGVIPADPLAAITQKVARVKNEFVMPAGMAKLQDLSTVDFKDFDDVRDRMLVFALCYDFALRVGEVALLKVGDIDMAEYISVRLRPEVQKGQKNLEVVMQNFFEESRLLVAAYLKMRTRLAPTTDALIVSSRGKPYTGGGCTAAVQRQCEKLDVVSTKGNTPSGHIFRHTMGTNNISSLGLCLDVYMVMQRLRHKGIDVTTRVYLNNNELLQKERHKAIVNGHRNGNGAGNGLAHGSAGFAGAASANRPATSVGVSAGFPSEDADLMSELDALKALENLGLTWQGLRKHAAERQASRKMGDDVMYPRAFVEDLATNWVTKQQVMQSLGFGSSRFFYWAKARGIEPVQIGKVCLVPAKPVVLELARKKTS